MKSKKLNSRFSITLPSVFWVVVLCSVAPAFAQDDLSRCDSLLQTVVDLRSSDRARERDILESRLQAATDALSCYDGRNEVRWLAWLMRQKIVALDGLQRYAEAQEVVDRFFSTYLDEADSAAVARFYMWDLRFEQFEGNFTEALESYEKGLPYAHKLPDDWYRHYLLNAGSIHMADGKFKEALNIYRDAHQSFTSVPSPSDSVQFELYGRSLLGKAEANLDLLLNGDQPAIDLEEVIGQLSQAANILSLSRSPERNATANAALGLAHALNENHRDGPIFLNLASSIIDRHNLRRERILLHYNRAQGAFLKKEYNAVHAEIDEALTLSERYGIAEFESRLRLLKGQTYEKVGQMKEALAAYRGAFNVAKDSSRGRDQYVYDLASESAFRIADQLPEETESAFPYLTYLFGFLGFLIIVALLAYFVWMITHRKKEQTPLQAEPPANVEAAPPPAPEAAMETLPVSTSETASTAETAPTPETASLPAEPDAPTMEVPTIPSRRHFDQVADAVGFPRGSETRERMCLAYQIRSEPDGFRTQVEHPVAHERLSRLKEDVGSSRNDVWACIEFYEEERGAQFTSARPGNAVGSQLRQQFGKLGIDWPQSLDELDRLLGLKA